MYTIIGADGKQYGPVNLNTLKQWLADGRATADTMVQPAGSTQWLRLGSLPELTAAASAAPVPAPGMPYVVPSSSGLAITSLVLGILSLFCSVFTALPGIICGIIGLNKINKSNGQLTGKGMAIAGICLSSVMLMVNLVLAGMLLPAISMARSKARQVQCTNNLKQIGLSLAQYASDYGDHLPDAQWCDRIMHYAGSRKIFTCPESAPGQYSYAFNENMLGKKFQQDSQAVLAVEYTDSWNALIDGPQLLITPPHRNGWNVLFNDGHVEVVPASRIKNLHWRPVGERQL